MPKKGGSSDQLGFLYPISGGKNSGQGKLGAQSLSEGSRGNSIKKRDVLCREEESISFLMEQLSKSRILDVKRQS